MAKFPASATYTLPCASTATPVGALNFAEVPTPLVSACVLPSPASVTTVPLGDTTRMAWFSVSATYRLPCASTAAPFGPLNLADGPWPSRKPLVLPASFVTVPLGNTTRMTWLDVSHTYTVPEASTAMPDGPLNCAVLPTPSVDPAADLPANVVVLPMVSTLRIMLLAASATNATPPGPSAMPYGLLNEAAVPTPLEDPIPEP